MATVEQDVEKNYSKLRKNKPYFVENNWEVRLGITVTTEGKVWLAFCEKGKDVVVATLSDDYLEFMAEVSELRTNLRAKIHPVDIVWTRD
jgi:hypothetical protein